MPPPMADGRPLAKLDGLEGRGAARFFSKTFGFLHVFLVLALPAAVNCN